MSANFTINQTAPIDAQAGLTQYVQVNNTSGGLTLSALGQGGNIPQQTGAGWASLVAPPVGSSSVAAPNFTNFGFYFLVAALAYFGFRKAG